MSSAELRAASLEVVARAAEVRESLADEVQARRDAAVSARLVSGDTEGLLSALPVAARRGHRRRVGRRLPDGASTRFAGRVLLDAEGRPLLHERVHDGYVLALWRHDRDRAEEVVNRGGGPHVTWVLHPIGAVGVDVPHRWVQRWSCRHGEVVRVDHAEAFEPVLSCQAATTSPARTGSTRTRRMPTRRRSTCSGTRSGSRRGWVASTGSADT